MTEERADVFHPSKLMHEGKTAYLDNKKLFDAAAEKKSDPNVEEGLKKIYKILELHDAGKVDQEAMNAALLAFREIVYKDRDAAGDLRQEMNSNANTTADGQAVLNGNLITRPGEALKRTAV